MLTGAGTTSRCRRCITLAPAQHHLPSTTSRRAGSTSPPRRAITAAPGRHHQYRLITAPPLTAVVQLEVHLRPPRRPGALNVAWLAKARLGGGAAGHGRAAHV